MWQRTVKHLPLLLGLLFLYTGVAKLLNPGQATMALESLEVPYALAKWIIAAVTSLELYLGILLLVRLDLRFALRLTTAMMLVFTALLWYLSTLASPPSCGCLGLTGIFEDSRVEALVGLARNFVILGAIQWTYAHHFTNNSNISQAEAGAVPDAATN